MRAEKYETLQANAILKIRLNKLEEIFYKERNSSFQVSLNITGRNDQLFIMGSNKNIITL